MKKEFKGEKDLKKINIIRDEEFDFEDDGNEFKGYTYKNMPISYLEDKDTIFLSVRVDYDPELNFEDYLKTDWGKLIDKYNGVKFEDVDLDELQKDLDEIIEGAKELKKYLKANKKVDRSILIRSFLKEKDWAKEYIKNLIITAEEIKNIYECDLREIQGYLIRLTDYAQKSDEEIKKEIEKLKESEAEEKIKRIKEVGCITSIRFYINEVEYLLGRRK